MNTATTGCASMDADAGWMTWPQNAACMNVAGRPTITAMEGIIRSGKFRQGVTRMSDYPYRFAWGNNPKRKTLKGRRCRVLGRMKKNSIVIEFENGQQEVVSRNSIRKVPTEQTEMGM